MQMPVLTRKRTPFDSVPVDVFQGLAEFPCGVALRWLDRGRSLSRFMARRARQRHAARGHSRGYRHVHALAPPHRSAWTARRRRL